MKFVRYDGAITELYHEKSAIKKAYDMTMYVKILETRIPTQHKKL